MGEGVGSRHEKWAGPTATGGRWFRNFDIPETRKAGPNGPTGEVMSGRVRRAAEAGAVCDPARLP